MSKIKEILKDFRLPIGFNDNGDWNDHLVAAAMREYAEFYAQKHQDNILNNFQFIYGDVDVEGTCHSEIVDLDYDSIPSLPEHD